MIKIVSAHIEEFRGIRKLDINLSEKTFVVSGPNGSGKSGVIDAIEFALTGQISRLKGVGTKGLTLTEHAPHVDMSKFPDAAFVSLEVSLPEIGKLAKITRKVSAPRKPKIEPNDPDVQAILAEVAQHTEITLARREILKFILVEPTKRSDQIQEILKIEELGQVRSSLNSAFGKLNRAAIAAEKDTQEKRSILLQHLGLSTLSIPEILRVVNTRRGVLGLQLLADISSDSAFDRDLARSVDEELISKSAALAMLQRLHDAIDGFQTITSPEAEALVQYIQQLEEDAQLFLTLQQRDLVQLGLGLVDGPACPMCDHEWPDEAHLLAHLHAKQAKSKAAGEIKQAVLNHATMLSVQVGHLKTLLLEVYRLAKLEKSSDMLESVTRWGRDLSDFQEKLKSLSNIVALKERLQNAWHAVPEGFVQTLAIFTETINAKPDQSATHAAQSFLMNAQHRFEDYRLARLAEKASKIACEAAKTAYDAWCTAMEAELDALYESVQDDFSKFYRILNDGDEQKFVARLKATAGRLDFDVNFYDRGLFPPGAFHSEGHQDGMGVCLYLALMRRLLRSAFTVSLLDDVVMSVDADHRYQFCKLLMTEFPNTQFVIATHDRVWAEQMRSAKLVSRKTSLVFDSWSVETGPLVESNTEIWAEIESALARGRVDLAAPILRRHMEFISRILADQLGARTVFRADNNYDLGGLLPNALSELSDLLGRAADAAQSWGNEEQKQKANARRHRLKLANTYKGEEEWTVNKAVHFNEWANFSPNDFKPVVQAFKEILACAQCDDCGSWLYIAPKAANSETLRCACNTVNFNLRKKPN